jgi:cell division protein FtsB
MNWRELWVRIQSLGFLMFAGIVGAAAVLLFVPILHRRHVMQQEIRRLDDEIAQQEAVEKQQKAEIEALKTDSSYVERTARGKLNLAKPNETVFKFEPPPTNPPVASRSRR